MYLHHIERYIFSLILHIWSKQPGTVCLILGVVSVARLLWNNEKYMLWNHIAEVHFSDLDHGLHQLPKLTADHINLNSFSKMKISFAAQVLSNTVSQALLQHYTSGEADETARFCSMINSFFYCANVCSTTEFVRKRNDFIAPYQSSDDVRFSWLENTFVQYLEDWKAAVDSKGRGIYS